MEHLTFASTPLSTDELIEKFGCSFPDTDDTKVIVDDNATSDESDYLAYYNDVVNSAIVTKAMVDTFLSAPAVSRSVWAVFDVRFKSCQHCDRDCNHAINVIAFLTFDPDRYVSTQQWVNFRSVKKFTFDGDVTVDDATVGDVMEAAYDRLAELFSIEKSVFSHNSLSNEIELSLETCVNWQDFYDFVDADIKIVGNDVFQEWFDEKDECMRCGRRIFSSGNVLIKNIYDENDMSFVFKKGNNMKLIKNTINFNNAIKHNECGQMDLDHESKTIDGEHVVCINKK